MTPLELSYPITGLILALGGVAYGWQSRRGIQQQTEALQQQQQALEKQQTALSQPTIDRSSSSGQPEEIHLKGQLNRLEQNLKQTEESLQAARAERESLAATLQSKENEISTLQQQLTQQQQAQTDQLVTAKTQRQELLTENSNLSERLKGAVGELADARTKLVNVQKLTAENEQLKQALQQLESRQGKNPRRSPLR